jgi:F-box/WD-40 domain protein 7
MQHLRLSWLRRKCEGHEDAVRVLAVASGKVFSGSYDGTIGVW